MTGRSDGERGLYRVSPIMIEVDTFTVRSYMDVAYALTSRMLVSARSKTRFVTNSVNL
jgi:hypothetical protein